MPGYLILEFLGSIMAERLLYSLVVPCIVVLEPLSISSDYCS